MPDVGLGLAGVLVIIDLVAEGSIDFFLILLILGHFFFNIEKEPESPAHDGGVAVCKQD